MAFTGTATIKQISDRLFRITGLSLAAATAGTIGFSDKTSAADVSLPAPTWHPYKNAEGAAVSLIEAVWMTVNPVTDVTAPVPISIVKTGTTHLDFVATLHNDTAGDASGGLEIYVEFH